MFLSLNIFERCNVVYGNAREILASTESGLNKWLMRVIPQKSCPSMVRTKKKLVFMQMMISLYIKVMFGLNINQNGYPLWTKIRPNQTDWKESTFSFLKNNRSPLVWSEKRPGMSNFKNRFQTVNTSYVWFLVSFHSVVNTVGVHVFNCKSFLSFYFYNAEKCAYLSYVTSFPNWSFAWTNLNLFDATVCVCYRARTKTQRIVSRFHVSTGKDGAPNLCPGELTQFSPPELCLGAGHLSGATGERLLQPSPNPGESIDASMAAGLSSTQVPQGELLISINVKWCCPQANMKATHTHIRYHTRIHIPTREQELICTQMWWRIGCPRGKIWRSDPVM